MQNMTDEEKKAIVDAVIAQLKSEGTDVSSTAIVEDVGEVATVICYDASGNIVRIAPLTLNAQESANTEAIAAEIERAMLAESANAASINSVSNAIDAISNALSNETTARQNADTELTNNQVRLWGVTASADGVNLLGKNNNGANVHSIDIPSATTEKAGVMTAEDKKEQVKKTPLANGDIIVGLAREVYSRQGKVDTATFLKRTTAGSTSISDGVASVKQIGGNIVKNLVDGTFESGWSEESGAVYSLKNGIYKVESSASYRGLRYSPNYVLTHKYYISVPILSNSHILVQGSGDGMASTYYYSFNNWCIVSSVWGGAEFNQLKISADVVGAVTYIAAPLLIDLTEMYGEGNEPTKEECDRMFSTVGALPQGLTVAKPTGLKSTGYNQWNPNNIIANKTITDGALVDSTEYNIAVVECLPCKTGAGENNGYVIGYGEGDTWSDDGIEVYLTPLNPLEVQGELYLCKLEKDATYNTYVPLISGYLVVVTPTTEKLCAHLHWSGDRAATDYEPYNESTVQLPDIPQMSEWGLAGIYSDGALVQDTVDLENYKYIKRIGKDSEGNYIALATPEEYPIVTKAAPNYIGSDYGVEQFTGSKVPLAANILFYMRSLVSETRNFLDRLMAGLGTSDVTTAADKIIAAVNSHNEVEEVIEETTE